MTPEKLFDCNIAVPSISGVIVAIWKSAYQNNNALAIVAEIEYNDGMSEHVPVSVNIDGQSDKLPVNHFACKSWSESEFLYKTLVDAAILVPTGETILTGYVEAPVCTLERQ